MKRWQELAAMGIGDRYLMLRAHFKAMASSPPPGDGPEWVATPSNGLRGLTDFRDADSRAGAIEVLRDRIRPWLQGATDANPTFETALEMVEARIAALEAEEDSDD